MVDFESPTDLLDWLDSLFTDETRPTYVIYDRACKVSELAPLETLV